MPFLECQQQFTFLNRFKALTARDMYMKLFTHCFIQGHVHRHYNFCEHV